MTLYKHKIESGSAYPLGATWDGSGVNFALFSAHAERVELCLFDSNGRREIAKFTLPENTNQVWHGYLPYLRPGTLYGYRVHGPYEPSAGHRFNANKLLIDPYARQLHGKIRWSDSVNAYKVGNKSEDLSFCKRDSANAMPKSVVIDSAYTWGSDQPPRVPWSDTIIYEAHVKGMTKLHPGMPANLQGTYSGMAEPVIIEHLKALGITSVELLPVQSFAHDRFLVEKGLRNYWGYSTLNYFTTHKDYSNGNAITDFKTMVRRLHDAGIEVILDVVYNHTAEGNHLGPHLSWRGIDNASYYRLSSEDKRYYVNDTGCGNTLNVNHPRVLQMVLDSLRYWVSDMHVDGFRFDLASTLGREPNGFDANCSLFSAIMQDPVLSGVKLIAEPWDLGPGGYQLGGFPIGWTEWNDRYRDTFRRYWCGENSMLPDIAKNLHGSSDVFESSHRQPWASINFITSHDGFTLHDLVSFEEKHNLENGEENRDGHHSNFSCNYGHEGVTEDEAINSLREKQKRNLLASLILSQGTPMIISGDELGHTKNGNNNAYCQDNEINWINWEALSQNNQSLNQFANRLTALRKRYPVLHRTSFVHGSPIAQGSELNDICWVSIQGEAMHEAQWKDPNGHFLAMLLASRIEGETDTIDQVLLLVFHSGSEDLDMQLPDLHISQNWRRLISTASPIEKEGELILAGAQTIKIQARSVDVWTLDIPVSSN